MSSLKVAVAQIRCEPADLTANLAAHLDAIARARGEGVELLLFPELSLTDYLAAPDCEALAQTPDAEVLMRLADAADGITISAGFIERDERGSFFNSQGLFRDGRLLAIHRKLNLPGYGALREDRVYARGSDLASVELAAGWRAATLICADAWNPALPWLAALGGANLLLLPAASALGAVGDGFDNPRGWAINLAHSAMTYGLPTLFANHCGTRGGATFWGGARILDASGHELARAGAGSELIVAELSQADGEAARRRLPTARDSDPALVGALLRDLISNSESISS
ncbi:nitrilase-related carbon-nitrogen hydrolase [Bosea sp. (in: a-proteobacteria)]|jgi:predicted amidohydrolase|uniref:nitrilase-related carbon-nitrogen hydrolase n=1 Tax=Bosea sp. (in: a-proteobacteria) TaxID=1871050 RepID=UPI002DDDA448|nr:nitrilase-related carbon-nitrogen hydrolase [Bosea sp. (in: a-proteobacteria)]HEV2510078.1 nitrilase-related carbon-nitrogen hydrolase [Bosea sp. (in: a-proteobacteria)]